MFKNLSKGSKSILSISKCSTILSIWEFDLVPYPIGGRVSDFVKFNGNDNRTAWEHIGQYIAQLG